MSRLTLQDLRRLNRRIAAALADIVPWSAFTLAAFIAALEQRLEASITLVPMAWERAAYFGLTFGYTGAEGSRWLLFYDDNTTAEQRLATILHELAHIALGHRSADLPVERVREILSAYGLLDVCPAPMLYTRLCLATEHTADGDDEDEQEYEAEVAAAWILTQVRRAGVLPAPGRSFLPEHRTIDARLKVQEPS